MFGHAWCLKGTRDIMEAAIKVLSIRVSGSLISMIRMVTVGLVDTIDQALHACSTGRTRFNTSLEVSEPTSPTGLLNRC